MITLKDKLSHLSYVQACKLLGAEGKKLISAGGKWDIDLFEQVTLDSQRFRLDLGEARVEIELDPMKPKRLNNGGDNLKTIGPENADGRYPNTARRNQ